VVYLKKCYSFPVAHEVLEQIADARSSVTLIPDISEMFPDLAAVCYESAQAEPPLCLAICGHAWAVGAAWGASTGKQRQQAAKVAEL
jgi:hypothetical protein